MKKIFIVSFIISLFMICVCSLVYATDVDMNLTSDPTVYGSNTNTNTNTNIDTNENNIDNTANADYSLDGTDSYSPNADITVGSTAALSSTNLSLSNILNIILIVLGILLVLFAIAILIRMR